MFTEMSDKFGRQRVRGWVLYDAACPICLDLLARTQATLQSAGFRPEPLQSPWVRERLKIPEDQLLKEMRVLTREGRLLGGADALAHIANQLGATHRPWWAWLLVIVNKLPFSTPVLRASYRWFAARRHCRQGVCAVPYKPNEFQHRDTEVTESSRRKT